MADVLSSIPGLGGYLAMQDRQRRNALGDLQGVMGLLSAVRQQQEAQQAAQLAPFRQQLFQAQAQHLQGLAGQQAREEAFQNVLPGLIKQATGPEGRLDWGRLAESLATTPGGLSQAMTIRKTEEDRAARVEQQVQNRQAQMERLAMQLGMQNQWKEASEETKRYLGQLAADTRMSVAQMANALRSGLSQADRREPFKFSVGGKNVQGWRDRFGNVFDPEGRPVQKYEPEITSADQKAAQERAAAVRADQVLTQNLERMEQLVSESPRTIAGPFSPALKAGGYIANAVVPGAVDRPGLEMQQLIEASLNEAEKAGKLSNQQKSELRSLFATGLMGDPLSVRKGIQLFRDYAGIRKAAASVPPARAVPGGKSVPPPPPGFRLDQ